MVNTEESNFKVVLVEAHLSLVISLEFYKSVNTKGYGKKEREDTTERFFFHLLKRKQWDSQSDSRVSIIVKSS